MARHSQGDCVFTTALYLSVIMLGGELLCLRRTQCRTFRARARFTASVCQSGRLDGALCHCHLSFFLSFFFAGLGCLIAGIVFFVDYYDPNEQSSQITAFNSKVQGWTSLGNDGLSAARRFASIPNITLSSPYGSVTLTPMIGRTYGEPLAPQGAGIAAYGPAQEAVYFGNGALLGAQLLPWSGGAQSFQIVATVTVGGATNTLFVTSVQFTNSKTYGRSKSGCRYGARQGSSDCVVQFFPGPQGLCLVADTSRFPWIISSNPQGGCAISPQEIEDAQLWSTNDVVWQRTNQVGFAMAGFPAPYSWPYSYPVVVRSSLDPWVSAAQSTFGSMTFGLQSQRYYKKATILTAVGGGLMAPFFLVVIVALIFTMVECVKTLNEGEDYGCIHCKRGVQGRTMAAFHATERATFRLFSPLRNLGRGQRHIDYQSDSPTKDEKFSGQNPMSPSQRAKAARGPAFEVEEGEGEDGGDYFERRQQQQRRGSNKKPSAAGKKIYRNEDDGDLDDDGVPDDEQAARSKHTSKLAVPSRAGRGIAPRAVSKGRHGGFGGDEDDDEEEIELELPAVDGKNAKKNWGKASAVMAVGSRNPLASAASAASRQQTEGGFKGGSPDPAPAPSSAKKVRMPRGSSADPSPAAISVNAMMSPTRPSRNSSTGPGSALSSVPVSPAAAAGGGGVALGSSAAMAAALNKMHRASTVMAANAALSVAAGTEGGGGGGGSGEGSGSGRKSKRGSSFVAAAASASAGSAGGSGAGERRPSGSAAHHSLTPSGTRS